jgi:hypothetical protein
MEKKMKQPTMTPKVQSVSPVEPVAPNPRAWKIVDDTVPRDGTLIEVKADPGEGDEAAVPAKWRITRQRDPATRSWARKEFWVNALTAERLPFEPYVWRLPEGFLLPGMVIA